MSGLKWKAYRPLGMAEYIYNALAKARYQILEDGSYYADIFLCPGVWATGDTLQECRDTLKEVLIDWLVAAYDKDESAPEDADAEWLDLYWPRMGD